MYDMIKNCIFVSSLIQYMLYDMHHICKYVLHTVCTALYIPCAIDYGTAGIGNPQC